jgi:hypothetical protein
MSEGRMNSAPMIIMEDCKVRLGKLLFGWLGEGSKLQAFVVEKFFQTESVALHTNAGGTMAGSEGKLSARPADRSLARRFLSAIATALGQATVERMIIIHCRQ